MSAPPSSAITELTRIINGLDGFARDAAATVGELNRDGWLPNQSLQRVAQIQQLTRLLAGDLVRLAPHVMAGEQPTLRTIQRSAGDRAP